MKSRFREDIHSYRLSDGAVKLISQISLNWVMSMNERHRFPMDIISYAVRRYKRRIKRARIMALVDRYRGALTGLASGDALGATLEYKAPGSFDPSNDRLGGLHHLVNDWRHDDE
jgi:hypothetical protein